MNLLCFVFTVCALNCFMCLQVYYTQNTILIVHYRGVPRAGFGNGAWTLKQYFVLPKNGSKYYLKYTFLVFPILGILGLGTPLVPCMKVLRNVLQIVCQYFIFISL